jgi:hypothetical protein
MTTYFKLLQMLLTGSSLKTDNEHWGWITLYSKSPSFKSRHPKVAILI